MNLILESRYVSFALRVSDARKLDDDDDDAEGEMISLLGELDPPPFGFQSTDEEDDDE